jgi:hypothetical protein
MIDEKTAILRQDPNKLDELLHPVFDNEAMANANEYCQKVYLHLQVLLQVELFSLLMMQKNGRQKVRK